MSQPAFLAEEVRDREGRRRHREDDAEHADRRQQHELHLSRASYRHVVVAEDDVVLRRVPIVERVERPDAPVQEVLVRAPLEAVRSEPRDGHGEELLPRGRAHEEQREQHRGEAEGDGRGELEPGVVRRFRAGPETRAARLAGGTDRGGAAGSWCGNRGHRALRAEYSAFTE
jgi:hypothetical protein